MCPARKKEYPMKKPWLRIVVIVVAVVLDAWRHRMAGSQFPLLKRLLSPNQ